MSPEEIQLVKDSLNPITDREMERLAGYEYSTSEVDGEF